MRHSDLILIPDQTVCRFAYGVEFASTRPLFELLQDRALEISVGSHRHHQCMGL